MKPLVSGKSGISYILAIFLLIPGHAVAQQSAFEVGGYIQSGVSHLRADLQDGNGEQVFREYRLQNRLQARWHLSPSLRLSGEVRTRVFGGDLVREFPVYATLIDTDPGWMNLSWMPAKLGDVIIHSIPDRLYAEFTSEKWNVRAGRQRINWGINMVTNPNDLFNIYSFYDFEYPERPGTDAVRVQYFRDWASRIEVAWGPDRRGFGKSTLAVLYAFNRRGYDVQLIAGLLDGHLAAGGGWAGNLRQSGLKGEIMYFSGVAETQVAVPGIPPAGNRGGNLVAAISVDHMFDSGVFVLAEGVYNHRGGNKNFSILGAPPTAANPTFSRYQVTARGDYAVSPVVQVSLAMIGYPDEEAVFLAPVITWSILTDLDFSGYTQQFLGSKTSVFADAGRLAAVSLKWSF